MDLVVSEQCRSNIFDWLWLLSSCWAIVCRMLGWPINPLMQVWMVGNHVCFVNEGCYH